MSKFKVSSKPNPGPAPASREQFAEGAAMVHAQTGGRPLKPIRVNFDLDLATHRRLKLRAMERGTNVAKLMRDLIETELNQ
jgi:hypothetical protein